MADNMRNREKKMERDRWLASQDFRILRFWNNEVLHEMDAVAEMILLALKNTPTPSLPRKGGGSGGFTLIEVAVVMLIIVIILGIVGVNLGPDRETPVRDEAHRLALLLQTAQQEAILQGRIYALAIERRGYYFLTLDENREFKPVEGDAVFRTRTLPAGISIESVDIEGREDADAPRLVILPTGDLPAFTITFSRDEFLWQVEGKATGKITAQALRAREQA